MSQQLVRHLLYSVAVSRIFYDRYVQAHVAPLSSHIPVGDLRPQVAIDKTAYPQQWQWVLETGLKNHGWMWEKGIFGSHTLLFKLHDSWLGRDYLTDIERSYTFRNLPLCSLRAHYSCCHFGRV
jgi:hypothetical protein